MPNLLDVLDEVNSCDGADFSVKENDLGRIEIESIYHHAIDDEMFSLFQGAVYAYNFIVKAKPEATIERDSYHIYVFY